MDTKRKTAKPRHRGGKQMKEEKILKSLIGQDYTPENAHILKYGAVLSSSGTIKRVLTKKDMEKRLSKCDRLKNMNSD